MTPVGRSVGDGTRCPRCRTAAALTVRYPHSWRNGTGRRVRGVRESLLCPRCDADDPAATGLLALLDGRSTGTAHGVFADLAGRWLDAARARQPDPAALAAEERRWRAGDL
jgi:hypothetical protein